MKFKLQQSLWHKALQKCCIIEKSCACIFRGSFKNNSVCKQKGENCSAAVSLCYKNKLELEKPRYAAAKGTAKSVCRKRVWEHLEISRSSTSPLPGVS